MAIDDRGGSVTVLSRNLPSVILKVVPSGGPKMTMTLRKSAELMQELRGRKA